MQPMCGCTIVAAPIADSKETRDGGNIRQIAGDRRKFRHRRGHGARPATAGRVIMADSTQYEKRRRRSPERQPPFTDRYLNAAAVAMFAFTEQQFGELIDGQNAGVSGETNLGDITIKAARDSIASIPSLLPI